MAGQMIPVPDGAMNGFTFTETINISQTSTSSLFASRPFAFSGVRGEIDEVFFQITPAMNGPGVHPLPTPGAGYCIDLGLKPEVCLGVSVPSDFRTRSRTRLTSSSSLTA
jgi:hypothetical protein